MDAKTTRDFTKLLRRLTVEQRDEVTALLATDERRAYRSAMWLNLSDYQRTAAVEIAKPEGDPINLIIAAAGSGKTTLSVSAVAEAAVSGKFRPEQIYVTTFTAKASGELKERLQRVIPATIFGRLRVGTFHALAMGFLKRHHKRKEGWGGGNCLDYSAKDRPAAKGYKPEQLIERILGEPRKTKLKDLPPQYRKAKSWEIPEDVKFEAVPGLPGFYGLDTKEDPRVYLSFIEAVKADGLDYGDEGWLEALNKLTNGFDTSDNDKAPKDRPTVAKIWEMYEDAKQNLKVWDLSECLVAYFKMDADSAKLVITDEAQDNNLVQLNIARNIAKKGNGRLFLVGDVRQCIPKGQMILTPTGERPVETIREGDVVMASCGGKLQPCDVVAVSKTIKQQAFQFTTETGRVFQATAEHVLFAAMGVPPGEDAAYVYLMYRRGYGFRVGITSYGLDTSTSKTTTRSQQEHADRMWLVGYCQTAAEARRLEHSIAYRFGIDPMFASDEDAAEFFREFEPNGFDALAAFGQTFERPAYFAKSTASGRVAINVSVGGTDGAQVSVESKHIPEDVQDKYGFTDGRRGCARLRRWFHQSRDGLAFAHGLAEACGGHVVETLSLTGMDRRVFTSNAAGVWPGMYVPEVDDAGNVWLAKITERTEVPVTECHDIEVDRAVNFVVGGVVVHNSIYEWRGAKPAFMIEARDLGAPMRELPVNYRSGQIVVDIGNEISKGKTWNIGMDAISFRGEAGFAGAGQIFPVARTFMEEANQTAQDIKRRLDAGEAPSKFAIITRTNATGAAYEIACLKAKVPVFRIGTTHGFFDRRMIKAAMGYAAMAEGADDYDAFEACVNLPLRKISPATVRGVLQACGLSPMDAVRYAIANSGSLPNNAEAFATKSTAYMLKALQSFNGAVALAAERPWRFLDENGTPYRSEKDRTSYIFELLSKSEEAKDADVNDATSDSDSEVLSCFLDIAVNYTGYAELAALRAQIATDIKGMEFVVKGDEEIAAMASTRQYGWDKGKKFEKPSRPKYEEDKAEFERLSTTRATILTGHKSKGLEYPFVYMSGTQGLFPHHRSSTPERYAEEMRLFYVAVTRAEDTVSFTQAIYSPNGFPGGASAFIRQAAMPVLNRHIAASVATALTQHGWSDERNPGLFLSPSGHVSAMAAGAPLYTEGTMIAFRETRNGPMRVEVPVVVPPAGDGELEWHAAVQGQGLTQAMGVLSVGELLALEVEAQHVYGSASGAMREPFPIGEPVVTPDNRLRLVTGYTESPLPRVILLGVDEPMPAHLLVGGHAVKIWNGVVAMLRSLPTFGAHTGPAFADLIEPYSTMFLGQIKAGLRAKAEAQAAAAAPVAAAPAESAPEPAPAPAPAAPVSEPAAVEPEADLTNPDPDWYRASVPNVPRWIYTKGEFYLGENDAWTEDEFDAKNFTDDERRYNPVPSGGVWENTEDEDAAPRLYEWVTLDQIDYGHDEVDEDVYAFYPTGEYFEFPDAQLRPGYFPGTDKNYESLSRTQKENADYSEAARKKQIKAIVDALKTRKLLPATWTYAKTDLFFIGDEDHVDPLDRTFELSNKQTGHPLGRLEAVPRRLADKRPPSLYHTNGPTPTPTHDIRVSRFIPRFEVRHDVEQAAPYGVFDYYHQTIIERHATKAAAEASVKAHLATIHSDEYRRARRNTTYMDRAPEAPSVLREVKPAKEPKTPKAPKAPKAESAPASGLRLLLESLKQQHGLRADDPSAFISPTGSYLWQGDPVVINPNAYRITYFWSGIEAPDAGPLTPAAKPRSLPPWTHAEIWIWTGPTPGTWEFVRAEAAEPAKVTPAPVEAPVPYYTVQSFRGDAGGSGGADQRFATKTEALDYADKLGESGVDVTYWQNFDGRWTGTAVERNWHPKPTPAPEPAPAPAEPAPAPAPAYSDEPSAPLTGDQWKSLAEAAQTLTEYSAEERDTLRGALLLKAIE
jgi:DNA helicase-2/ATP-dependent DNA helicase PcrA